MIEWHELGLVILNCEKKKDFGQLVYSKDPRGALHPVAIRTRTVVFALTSPVLPNPAMSIPSIKPSSEGHMPYTRSGLRAHQAARPTNSPLPLSR